MREKDIRHPKEKIGSLKKILDQSLSRLIRKHEARVGCITCGNKENLQAGHFRSRRFFSTRYDPMNVHAQCIACNFFKYGMLYEYGLELDKRYGEGTAAGLQEKSQKLRQWEVKELIELIKASKENYGAYGKKYRELEIL